MSDSEATAIKVRVIFVCGDRSYTVRDVIDAALFRGELEPEWKNLLRLLAAEEKADEQDLEFDDAAIDAAAERFRYEHDLITAEETGSGWRGADCPGRFQRFLYAALLGRTMGRCRTGSDRLSLRA